MYTHKIAYVLTQPDQIGGPLTYNKRLISSIDNYEDPNHVLLATYYIPDDKVKKSFIPVDGQKVKILSEDTIEELSHYDLIHITSHLGSNDVAEYKSHNNEPRWLSLLRQVDTDMVVTVHDRTAICDTKWSHYLRENCVLHLPRLKGVIYWRKGFDTDVMNAVPLVKDLPMMLQKPFIPVSDTAVISRFSDRPKSTCYFGRPVTNKGMSRYQRALPVLKSLGYSADAYVSYNIFWMDIKKFENDASYKYLDNVFKNYNSEDAVKLMREYQFIFNPGWAGSTPDPEAIPEWAMIEALMAGCIPVLSENYAEYLKAKGFYCISHPNRPKYDDYVKFVKDTFENLPSPQELDDHVYDNLALGNKLFDSDDMLNSYLDFYDKVKSH